MRANGSGSLEVGIGKKFTFFPAYRQVGPNWGAKAPSLTFLKAFVYSIAYTISPPEARWLREAVDR